MQTTLPLQYHSHSLEHAEKQGSKSIVSRARFEYKFHTDFAWILRFPMEYSYTYKIQYVHVKLTV